MSFSECLIIALVALVVFGPEHLPGLARLAGRTFAKCRALSDKIAMRLEEQMKLDELTRNEAKANEAERSYERDE